MMFEFRTFFLTLTFEVFGWYFSALETTQVYAARMSYVARLHLVTFVLVFFHLRQDSPNLDADDNDDRERKLDIGVSWCVVIWGLSSENRTRLESFSTRSSENTSSKGVEIAVVVVVAVDLGAPDEFRFKLIDSLKFKRLQTVSLFDLRNDTVLLLCIAIIGTDERRDLRKRSFFTGAFMRSLKAFSFWWCVKLDAWGV